MIRSSFSLLLFSLSLVVQQSAFAQQPPQGVDRQLIGMSRSYANYARQGCWPVDYTAQMGQVRNQGRTSWCFAYAAADLVSQRSGVVVSAVDIGAQYFLNDLNELMNQSDPALIAYIRSFPGLARHLTNARRDAASGKEFKEEPLLNRAEGGFVDLSIFTANGRGLCPESNLPSSPGFSSEYIDRLKFFVENSQRAAMRESLVLLNHNREWMTWADRVCRRVERPVPLVPVSIYAATSPARYRQFVSQGAYREQDVQGELIGRLNFALSHGRIAVVSYDANLLADFEGEDAPHASSIVARTLVNGQCQYLLRNSWGESCNGYRDQFKSRCQNGHIWVTEAELRQSVYGLTFLR